MKKNLLTFITAICFSAMAFGQVPTQRVCGTLQHHEYLKQTRPNYQNELVQYNQVIEQYLQDRAAGLNVSKTNNSSAIVTIPVVVHVVYNTGAENISDAQAASQVQVLNDDFAKLNTDANKVTQPTFSTVASGAQIRFCLAQRDPSGNPTTGIVHKSTAQTSFGTNDGVKSNASGGDDPWDVTKYVNVWICDLSGTLLGYGEFPTGSISPTWGLVIDYAYAGSGGSATAPFNLGRTGTHEFGHCFNLNHIWGDETGCAGSDNCADTPNQGAEHYGCFAQGSIQTDACSASSPGTMWMNYMDYTDDACMYMFTANQVARMEAVVNTAPWNVLQSSNACSPPIAVDGSILNILAPIDGSSTCNNSVTPRITFVNTGSLTATSASIRYRMDATATQTINWAGSLASGSSTVLTLNNYAGLTNAAHTFSVWVATVNGSADTYTANNTKISTFTVTAAPVGGALPFTEGFESGATPPAGWALQKTNTIDATVSWSVIANATGLTGGSTRVARMDNYSSASDIHGQIDALRSPPLTFTAANTSLSLTFDVSHRPYATTTYIDTLNVYISTDCGGTWTKLYTKGGAQLSTAVGTQTTAFTPTVNTQWRRETVSLSSYAGQSTVYMKFESKSGYGNNLYLDNINISYTAAAVPVASFTSSATKCSGTAIAFTDQSTNTPTSWAWSFPGGSPPTSTSQNPSITYTAGGTYTVTLQSANANGTSTAVSQTITVNATPTVAANNATICSGTSTVLTASGATTYTWMPGGITSSSISVAPTSPIVYTVTGATSGCTNTRTVSVMVNATPTVTANNATICAGTSTVLTASGAVSYTWMPGVQTTASISVNPTVTTVYTVTGSNGSCSNTITVSVTVNNAPVVTASTSGTLNCTTTSVNVSATTTTTPVSYNWSGTGITAGAGTGTITVNQPGAFSYTVTNTSTGCMTTGLYAVTQNTAAPTLTVSGTQTITCAAPTVTLVGSATPSTCTPVWTGGVASGANSYTATASSANIYTLTVTNPANGCVATRTTQVLSSAGMPVVNATVTNSLSCTTLTAQVIATTTSTPVSYNWSGPSITAGATTATATVNGPGTYTVVVTNTLSGCSSTVTTNVIQNITAPSVSGATSGTLTCTTLTVNAFATTTTTPVSYNWTGTGIVSGAATGTVTINQPGVFNYTVTNTSNGCKATGTRTVTQNIAVPSLTVSGTQTVTCATPTVQLIAVSSPSSGVTYNWASPVTGSLNNNAISNPIASGSGIFTVQVTNTVNGCTNSATTNVVMDTAIPTVTAGNSGSITCTSTTATAMVSTTASPVSYSWSGTGIISGAATSVITVNQGGVFNYMVTNTANGCAATGSVAVTSNTTAPTVSVSSATICSGATATLTASGSAATYSWNTGATGANLMVSPTGNTSYTATATNTINGCTNTAVGNVVVGSAPSISVNSATICTGGTATLTASGVTTYTWNPGSLNGSTQTVNPTGTTVYTVTGNLSGCGATAMSTATVTVMTPVTPTMAPLSGPMCINSPTVALSASPSGGTFSGAGVTGSVFDPAAAGAGTITITYNYGPVGCSASDNQNVVVDLCTGIIELNNATVSVYPNPTRDAINIKLDASMLENTTIELYDAIGKLVIKERVNTTVTTLSLSHLAKGMYTIRVVSNDSQSIIKIVKE